MSTDNSLLRSMEKLQYNLVQVGSWKRDEKLSSTSRNGIMLLGHCVSKTSAYSLLSEEVKFPRLSQQNTLVFIWTTGSTGSTMLDRKRIKLNSNNVEYHG